MSLHRYIVSTPSDPCTGCGSRFRLGANVWQEPTLTGARLCDECAAVSTAAPTPYYTDDAVTLHHGDCLEVLRTLPDCSVDSVVTDPPYGISFMGRDWDAPGRMTGQLATGDETRGAFAYGGTHDRGHVDHDPRRFQQWCIAWATECLRVLKPGGHMVAFGGSRTWHRLAAAVEDAGFEIRDSIAWLYGSGFPKSLDVSKAIDARLGATREKVRVDASVVRNPKATGGGRDGAEGASRPWIEAALERGYHEKDGDQPASPEADAYRGWGTALKPAFEPIVVGRKPLAGTVAANVLAHGTGALNIDATRTAHASADDLATSQAKNPGRADLVTSEVYGAGRGQQSVNDAGRWPTNVLLDDSQAAELDDSGGASRFFPTFRYEAKAPTSERPRTADGTAHPTVKPLDLMRWLVRLVTPPGGTVLEPFAGSGTTAEACVIEGFQCIAIEREADYLPLIVGRLTKPIQVGLDFGGDL